jgi:O-antigen/teichoic acid export membrane protein
MKSAMSKHRQFPQYNLPYSLVGTASREFLVFALTFFHLTQSAGFYALARSVLYAPVSFLSASLSQVFYREAAESIGSPELERLAERLIRAIVIQFTPAFVALTVWGPELFELVFGTQWREAGTYAAIFAPAAYLFLFSSWPERLFEVTGRQRLSLTIQLIFDMLTVFAMMLLLARGYGPIAALVAFTAIACVYHCTYVTAAFRIAQFSSAVLWRAAVLAVALAIMAAFAFLACGQLDKAAGLAAAVGMTAFYSVGSFIWLLSKHRGRSESLPQESGE